MWFNCNKNHKSCGNSSEALPCHVLHSLPVAILVSRRRRRRLTVNITSTTTTARSIFFVHSIHPSALPVPTRPSRLPTPSIGCLRRRECIHIDSSMDVDRQTDRKYPATRRPRRSRTSGQVPTAVSCSGELFSIRYCHRHLVRFHSVHRHFTNVNKRRNVAL